MRVLLNPVPCLVAALAIVLPATALADGRRDLEDAIAFYENLDTDRAIARLQSALASGDLGLEDRATAYLYLGMVRFELGNRAEAEKALHSAFDLSPDIGAPEGTSPKTIEAIEAARKTAKSAPPTATPPVEPTPPGGEAKPPPEVQPEPPPPAITDPSTPPAEDEGLGIGVWIGIAVGAAALVAGGVVAGVLLSGGDCDGAGACASVTYQLP